MAQTAQRHLPNGAFPQRGFYEPQGPHPIGIAMTCHWQARSCCHAGSRRTAEAKEAGMQYGATKDRTTYKSDLAADASRGSREGAQGAGAQTGVGARSQPNDLMAEFLYHEMVNHTATRHIVFAPGLDFDALVDLCMDNGGPIKPSGVLAAARTRYLLERIAKDLIIPTCKMRWTSNPGCRPAYGKC